MNSGPNLNLWIIPLIPLAGAAINGLFGRRFSRLLVSIIALGSTGITFAYALWVTIQFFHLSPTQIPHIETLFPWIQTSDFLVNYGFYLDQLSLVMLLVVTGIGFLIHVYSAGYMAEEGGYYRFFSYLNLFMFFMLTLVLAHNYLLMFVGWEGVGLASYLLIGFFFLKDSAAQAGKKAFITNRVGDYAFLLGMFLLIKNFHSLDYSVIFKEVGRFPVEQGVVGTLTVTALLLMFGACGKSAQIPLYVWLPDAMEGPTPVSALIHAATMVTAGVYMIARSNAIFTRAPYALLVVVIIGSLTAILAASIGLVQTDIKRVLAYSTVSQLGYMFMACGVAAFSAGIFHLMTHAFFKALLFLAAGSVIHALGGEQDMRNMGGLRKHIPWTFWVMTIATIAIAGIPPLAGFFSKDEILWKEFSERGPGGHIFWLIGVITAGMTSFYMFRLWFLTFFGELRQKAAGHDPHEEPHGAVHAPGGASAHAGVTSSHAHGHAAHGHGGIHESPWIMLAPLVVLAIGSIVAGWVGVPEALGGHNKFDQFLAPVFHNSSEPAREAENAANFQQSPSGAAAESQQREEKSPEEEKSTELILTGVSVGVAILGFLLAWQLYYRRPELPDRIAAKAHGLYRTLVNKYYVDEAYYATLVNPIVNVSRDVLWRGVDVEVIDGLVNGAGTTSKGFSNVVRRMQSGNIRSYAGWVAIGAALVIAYIVWVGVR
ncbi:MAG TPA: NADH-quinone oxidoreductase subunit L [Terriglobales bacterium]